MKNIVLVGFMGTGKTVVAKTLAKRLGMKYVSTDDLIEEREKVSIPDIFSKKGEKYFREVEKNVIKDVSLMENMVIDAGGGVVINAENVKNLNKKGVIICLWAEPEVILQRTKHHTKTKRPLLNVREPLGKIEELLAFRKSFYERADYHIRTSGMSVDKVADEVEGIIKNA
ncbi:MAG: shikimate kinase [Candidatus Omnitrophica bacterium]|nr:shikimate kinase [Candidatus Omnitrophota bacterium]